MTAWQEIESKLLAQVTAFYLISPEEQRISRALLALAEKLGRSFLRYSEYSGLIGLGAPGELTPETVLPALAKLKRPALLFLPDFHRHLQNPLVARQLKELMPIFAAERQAVFIIAPKEAIPLELSTTLSVLDIPLPDASELAALLARLLAEARITLVPEAAERLVRVAAGLSFEQAERLFRRLLLDPQAPFEQVIALATSEKRRLIEADGVLSFQTIESSLSDVGGLKVLKEWFAQREAAFLSTARAYKLPEPKGLLLLGVQGCGKSLAAKAVAANWGLPLVALDFGAVFSQATRTPEQTMRQATLLLEAMAPVVLWIDEIEKAFAGARENLGDVKAQRVFGQFLTWLQEKKRPVFVVATANNIGELPPELLRKGRFDEIFFIDLPDVHERREILAIHLKRRGFSESAFDFDPLLSATRNFTGAELEHVVNDALYRAFVAKHELGQGDLLAAAQALVPLYNTYEEDIKKLREWARLRARRASQDNSLTDYFTRA